jgi:hypothetical protein
LRVGKGFSRSRDAPRKWALHPETISMKQELSQPRAGMSRKPLVTSGDKDNLLK